MEGTTDQRRSLDVDSSLVADVCRDVTFFYKTGDHAVEEEISVRELVVYIRKPRYDLYLNIDHIAKYLAVFHIQAFGSGIRLVVDSLHQHAVDPENWLPVSYGYKIHSNAAMWSLRQNKSHLLSADFMVEIPSRFEEIVRRHPVEMSRRNEIGYIVLYVPLNWFEKEKTIENLLLLPHTLNVGVTDIKRMQHERMRRFHRKMIVELEEIGVRKLKRREQRNPYQDIRDGSDYSFL